MTDQLALAVVRGAHGLKGELSLRSFSGDAGRLTLLREAILRKGAIERVFRVESTRLGPRQILMKLRGIDTPELAKGLVGYELWAGREHAAPLARNEYYEADLCRCRLFFGGELIGDVRSVLDAGSSQLLEVSSVEGRMLLVPFIDHFIGEVDVGRGLIFLREDEIVR